MVDQIVFRRVLAERRPGDEEVEIAVQAASLNFKDIMNAMRRCCRRTPWPAG